MKSIFYYQSNIGKIAIVEENSQIIKLFLNSDNVQDDEYVVKETDLLREANKQLQEYFSGTRKVFSLPLNPYGTKFMKKVWQCLCDIPYGTTQSYKEIAEKTGHSRAYRAVGLANNQNPIPIFIPCHRVIGSNGKLVGYRGGLDVKSYLLVLEQNNL